MLARGLVTSRREGKIVFYSLTESGRSLLSAMLPWHACLFAALVVGYAFSPIDLIPDPIPVLGYLDDLLLAPLGIALAIKLIPPGVLAEHRAQAQKVAAEGKPINRTAAAVVAILWVSLAVLAVYLVA